MSGVYKENDDIVETALHFLNAGTDRQNVLPPLDDLAQRRLADEVLHRFEQRVRAGKRRQKRAILLVAAMTFVIGGGIVLLSGAYRETGGAPLPPALKGQKTVAVVANDNAMSIPASRFEMLHGEVFSGNRPVATGTEVPAAEKLHTGVGQASFSLPTGIAAGMAQHTTVRVLWGGDGQYGVSLIRGMVLFSVDPEQKRNGFFVDTPAGTLRVTGTLFTVIVTDDGRVFVKLHRGRLLLEKPGNETIAIGAEKLIAVNGDAGDLRDFDRDMAVQMQVLGCTDRSAIFTELTDVACVANSAAQNDKSVAENLKPELRRLPLKELMANARNRKTEGNWRAASQSYQQVIRHYPESGEARTSLVSLGQIQLNHLGNERGALLSFSQYLTRPGPLTQEAMYGQALAWRSLGDFESERKTLMTLRAAFPWGLHAETAEKRLKALDALP